MATEDRRLINRIRSGDKEVFEELVQWHYEDVLHTATAVREIERMLRI